MPTSTRTSSTPSGCDIMLAMKLETHEEITSHLIYISLSHRKESFMAVANRSLAQSRDDTDIVDSKSCRIRPEAIEERLDELESGEESNLICGWFCWFVFGWCVCWWCGFGLLFVTGLCL